MVNSIYDFRSFSRQLSFSMLEIKTENSQWHLNGFYLLASVELSQITWISMDLYIPFKISFLRILHGTVSKSEKKNK